VWLLSLTQTIVMPVITACVIAAVASPVIAWLKRHGVGRGLGAILMLLALAALAVGVVVMVTGGILSQTDELRHQLAAGLDELQRGLTSLGVSADEAQSARETVSRAAGDAVPAMLHGVVEGIGKLSPVVFFLSLTALSVLFLLKDGPAIRQWAESHTALPVDVAHAITGRMLQSLRGYFVGVTAVALFNGVIVGLGAVIIGVPLAGTMAIVTFLGAYVPYLGAWTAGVFTVVVALGGVGPDAAVAMAIISLLANGLLQQLVQPIAYGAALGIHPLAVLIVTIGGGALFGAVGLILAAPVTSALTRISTDLSGLRGGTNAVPAADATAERPEAAIA